MTNGLRKKRRNGLSDMEKPKPIKVVGRILPTKDWNTSLPVEKILKGTGKITNKEWAEHWFNIVVMSEMWKAILRVVKK